MVLGWRVEEKEASNESKECEVKEFRGIALKKEKEWYIKEI